MAKPQSDRVQGLSRKVEQETAGCLREGTRGRGDAAQIEGITNQRMAAMRQVYSYLVRAAGGEAALEQRDGSLVVGECVVAGKGGLAPARGVAVCEPMFPLAGRMPILEQISMALNHVTGVVAGLVPATPNVEPRSKNNRGGRDKPGHDRDERPSVST